jgi:hypothetical protein
VDHEAVGRGAVPVVLARFEEDAVAGTDDLDGPAFALTEADPLGDEDRLAVRVGVPGGARAGREVDRRRRERGRPRRSGDGVDVDVAGEPVGGARWSAEATPTSPARQRLVDRFDMSLPENQRKLEATEALGRLADEAGLSLIELAIAFAVNHPAVTSAIIGPRTMEQLDSQLPAADATLDAALLDRIDAIVRPGVNLNPADTSYREQVLEPTLRRRGPS